MVTLPPGPAGTVTVPMKPAGILAQQPGPAGTVALPPVAAAAPVPKPRAHHQVTGASLIDLCEKVVLRSINVGPAVP